MYDTYAQRIYEWLRDTFYPAYQDNMEEILSNVADITAVVRYGLYLGVFALLLWVLYAWLRPYLFKM